MFDEIFHMGLGQPDELDVGVSPPEGSDQWRRKYDVAPGAESHQEYGSKGGGEDSAAHPFVFVNRELPLVSVLTFPSIVSIDFSI